MITLPYAVCQILEAVLRVNIAHQTLLFSAVRTGEFTRLMACQTLAL